MHDKGSSKHTENSEILQESYSKEEPCDTAPWEPPFSCNKYLKMLVAGLKWDGTIRGVPEETSACCDSFSQYVSTMINAQNKLIHLDVGKGKQVSFMSNSNSINKCGSIVWLKTHKVFKGSRIHSPQTYSYILHVNKSKISFFYWLLHMCCRSEHCSIDFCSRNKIAVFENITGLNQLISLSITNMGWNGPLGGDT